MQADEDTVRDVIHRFNEIGLVCLDLSGREAVSAPACSMLRICLPPYARRSVSNACCGERLT